VAANHGDLKQMLSGDAAQLTGNCYARMHGHSTN